MPGLEDWPGWVTASGSGIFFFFAYRIWLALRDSLSGQSTQWRSENRYIEQLQTENEKLRTQRDEAVNERNDLFARLAKMEARMQIMEDKFNRAQAEIEALKAERGST